MPELQQSVPKSVTFHRDRISRIGNRGDNWCITWAADDSQVTSMDDGAWINLPDDTAYHNHVYRVFGEAHNFTIEDVPGYPRFIFGEGGWFGYGIVSVDGTLYSAVSKTPDSHWSGPFPGVKLLRSDDNGRSWSRVDRNGNLRSLPPGDPASHIVNSDEMFFYMEAEHLIKNRLLIRFRTLTSFNMAKTMPLPVTTTCTSTPLKAHSHIGYCLPASRKIH